MPSQPQVKIAGLLGLVLVAGLSVAALKIANDEWAGGITSLSLFLLIASWLGVLFARGPARAFWTGFALLGWSYVVLIHVPILHEAIGRHLLAPRISGFLDPLIHPEPVRPPGVATATGFRSVLLMGGLAPVSMLDTLTPFGQIVIALESLLWAWLGGLFARHAFRSRPAPVTTPLPPIEPPAPAPVPLPVPDPIPAPPVPPSPPTTPVRLGTVSKLPPSSA